MSRAVNDGVTIDGEGMSRGELGMTRSSLGTLWGRGKGCETVRRWVWLRACRSRERTDKELETRREPRGLARARMDGCSVDVGGWDRRRTCERGSGESLARFVDWPRGQGKARILLITN